jgi:hypothetical protein
MSWPEMDHANPLASAQGEEKSAGDPIGGKGILQQWGTPWGTGDCTDNKKIIFRKLMVLDALVKQITCKVKRTVAQYFWPLVFFMNPPHIDH